MRYYIYPPQVGKNIALIDYDSYPLFASASLDLYYPNVSRSLYLLDTSVAVHRVPCIIRCVG
jgi:hypothetical protein